MRKFLCDIFRMIQSYAKIVRIVRIQTWRATEACWHTSLAMFCGLASRLAQSLAPKHAVSPVAAHEPQATVDMHAKVAGRPIYHKATLGMMGFASSCGGLQRAPRSNAARSESTSSRCETSVSAQPLPSHARFLPSSHSSFRVSFQASTSRWRCADAITAFSCY